jgi:hypothetical protein
MAKVDAGYFQQHCSIFVGGDENLENRWLKRSWLFRVTLSKVLHKAKPELRPFRVDDSMGRCCIYLLRMHAVGKQHATEAAVNQKEQQAVRPHHFAMMHGAMNVRPLTSKRT